MEELGNKPGISDANNNIGMVYYYMGKYDKTIEFYKKSLKIDEELGSKSGVALSYNNIGSVYDGIANDAVGFKNNKLALPNYDTAIAYYSKSLTICLEIKDKKGLMLNYNNLGATFCGKGNCSSSEGNSLEAADNYKKAIQFHEKSLALKKESGDKNGIAGSFVSLGEINLFLKNYKEAITYFNEGLSLAKKIGAKERIKFAFAGLSKSYAGIRKFEKAYDYHVEFADVKDSIYNEETSQQMRIANFR